MASMAHAPNNANSRTERIKAHQAEAALEYLKNSKRGSGYETDTSRTMGLRKLEEESDLKLAEDLLGYTTGTEIIPSAQPDTHNVDGLNDFSIFKPETAEQFDKLCDILVAILAQNYQHPYYFRFSKNLFLRLAEDLPADEIRKIGGILNRQSEKKLASRQEN